ncbi:MAG: hypothetical protein DI535_13630 [Citrobacter freundii]|nr:MAG: hypothetical protein DI535_13630 [Citrobacter freundii]
MSKEIWIYVCGVHSLLFAIFHIAFWKIFKWKTELPKLSRANSGIMQILNSRLTFVFLLFAFLCFFYPRDLYTTRLGQALLAGISLFWLGRLIEQFIFFPMGNVYTHLLTVLFFLGFVLFLLPVVA